MKLTLLPKDILSPVGSVNSLLSSNTLLSASIHSGSTSPSHMTQHRMSLDSLAAYLAAAVNTPLENSLVSWLRLPNNYVLGRALGLRICTYTCLFIFSLAFLRTFQIVLLPHPDGPTSTAPVLYLMASLNYNIFSFYLSIDYRPISFITTSMASSSSMNLTSVLGTPGNISSNSLLNLLPSEWVNLDRVLILILFINNSASSYLVPSCLALYINSPATFRHVLSALSPQS